MPGSHTFPSHSVRSYRRTTRSLPSIASPLVLLALSACATPGQQPAVGVAPEADPPAHEPGRVPPPGPYLPSFRAIHYQIAVDLPAQGTRFTARARIDVALLEPHRDTLRLDLTGLRAHSATVTVGREAVQAVGFRQHDGRLYIALPAGAFPGDTIAVEIAYGGEPDDGLIIRANLHGDRGAFGDNWPDRARFWFPSIDHPSHKATAEFEVRAPAGWEVIANGKRVLATGEDARGPPASGVWRWAISEPIPTYLMVIGATDFAIGEVTPCAAGGRTQDRPDGCVPVGYWVFPRDSANGARIFRRAGDMTRYFSELVAPFPYAQLNHVQSATRFGGMENATAIFYSEQAIARGTLSEGTVSHEIAHQWFGNSVTPGRWNDLWLSEGFATYFGMLYFEHADGAEAFREMRERSWDGYLRSEVTGLAVVDTLRVPDDNLLSLLNANSYNKGGAVLHMLRGLLGDDAFFDGVRRYYMRHHHGNALTADLRRALEQVSARDLRWFFEQWLYGPGHPVLAVSHQWDAAARETVITIDQVQSPDWPTFRMPVEVEIHTPAGPQRHRVQLEERRTVSRVPAASSPTAIRVDPDGWLLKEMAVN